MKKNLKSSIVLLITLTMLLGLFSAGCTNTGTGTSATTTRATTTSAASNEPVTLRVLTQDVALADYSLATSKEYPVVEEIMKQTNVKIEFEVTTRGANFDQLVETRFAAGMNLPDISYLGWGMELNKAMNLANQGLIIPINDLIDAYAPNIKKSITQSVPSAVKDNTAPDGKIYWVSNLLKNDSNFLPLVIRKDWLDKVGINKIPQTTDELYQALKAMNENDANGNGLKDEMFSQPYWGCITLTLGEAFGVQYGNIDEINRMGTDKNGKVYMSWLHPGSKQFLMYLNKLYKEGLIDPELPIMTYEKFNPRVSQNMIASTLLYVPSMPAAAAGIDTGGDPAEYAALTKLKGPNGDYGNFKWIDGADASKWVITKDCKNPEAAIKFLDYFHTPEYIIMMDFGIEGLHHQIVDGKPIYTEAYQAEREKDATAAYMSIGLGVRSSFPQVLIGSFSDYLEKNPDKNIPEIAGAMNEIMQGPISTELRFGIPSSDELAKIDDLGTEFTTYINEMVIKFFFGQESFDDWDKFVTKANELGAKEFIEIHQTMYDRYSSVK